MSLLVKHSLFHFFSFDVNLGPFTWNIIARLEYTTSIFSRYLSIIHTSSHHDLSFISPSYRIVAGGNKKIANYILAFYIVGIGCYRDYCFHNVIASQPVIAEVVNNPIFLFISFGMIGVGQLVSV